VDEIDTLTCAASKLLPEKLHFGVFFNQIFAASGTSPLGTSAMASFGHAARHTPHPKHLVGSI